MGDDLNFFTLALASLALASLVVSRQEIAAAWRPGVRLQAMAAQVLVAGGMLSAANFVGNKLLMQISTLAVFVALMAAATVGAGQVRPAVLSRPRSMSPTPGPPVLALLLLWAWLYLVDLILVPEGLFGHAVVRLGSGLALAFFLLVQRHSPIAPIQFYSASLITIVAIAAFTPMAPQWFRSCDRFKCSEVNAILQGPFVSGNLLGLSAAMCAALLLMTAMPSARSIAVLFCLLPVLYATMSRTSLMAVGAAFALFGIDHFVFRGRIRDSAFGAVAAVAALVAGLLPIVLGMFLVFSSSWDAFSERGALWARGRDAVWGFVVTGRGVDLWDVLAATSYFGSGFDKFTHSEYLLIYFAGGVVGLALYGAVMFRITYVAIRIENSIGRGAVLPFTFGVCGMVETVWNPLTIDAGTWMFFAVIAVACPRLPAENRTPTGRLTAGMHAESRPT